MNKQEKAELVNYKVARAKETLKEVELHIQNELWITAVNRLYYACFYAITALLIQNDIESQTHSGTRQMFGLHFVKTGMIGAEQGKFYTVVFNLRQTGDYDAFVEFDREMVAELLISATRLVNDVNALLAMQQ